MRIGFDANVLTGERTAAAHYLAKLVEALVRANERIEIVLFSPDKICVDYEPYIHFPQVTRVVAPLPKKMRGLWPAKVLPGLLAEHAIDIFHAPIHDSLPLFSVPCPTVITVFDMVPRMTKNGLAGIWEAWRYRVRHWMWARKAQKVLTVSETGKMDVMWLCRVSAEQVVVTPLGAGDEALSFISKEEEAGILRKYKLEDKTYVLSVSGLDKSRRNPDFLIEAFAQCHRALPHDVYFVFTGNNYRSDGQYARTLRKMERLGLRDKVIATGYIPDRVFRVILSNAAVSVVTPFFTGTPLAVLDSFSFGVPVVASDRGAIPEVASDAAVLVDPYDSPAIANAVKKLLEDPVEHDLYAEKALNRAKDFSWDRMAEGTLEVYKEIISD
ncbi:MAG: glycosyltransferase family 4 protein [Candidatus Omnitrophica bacterium]|nr:glycosyltransferase family 4 protein [Candidatus Omnitrophota bacterium]